MLCKDRILSEEYYDVITDFPIQPEGAESFDLCVWNVEDLYNLIYIKKEELENTSRYFYEHRSRPKLYALSKPNPLGGYTGSGRLPMQEFDPTSLIASGILQLQREPLRLTGRGVVTVFIDTGIDYLSPVFRNADGSSRILAIWDQTIQTGEPPEQFLYGSLYTKEKIDMAIQSANPYEIVPSRDENGHGTALASTAVGTKLGEGRTFIGAAPEADIVVVKLKQCKQYLREFYLIDDVPAYEENDIMQAVQFGETFVRNFQRPVVYCIGLCTSWGDHAGNSALSGYLSAVGSKRSRAVILCGGDEGNAAHHFRGDFGVGIIAAGRKLPVEIKVGDKAKGFLLEFWGNVPDVYTISIRSPGGETIPAIRLGQKEIVTYSFVYERTRVSIAGTLVEPVSGEELITVRMEKPTAGIWTIYVEAVGDIHNGVFNMWLPLSEFLNTEVFFTESSPYVTLTEPAMARNTISVSAYNAVNSGFLPDSGRGLTAVGAVKPDIAAPGFQVSTLRGKETGSGLAAAITTGAVAQFMQWAVVEGNNPVVESREIRNYLARGAERSFDLLYPSREWGYGKLNIMGTFDALIGV